MEDLEKLRLLVECTRENLNYQRQLRGVLSDLHTKAKFISSLRRNNLPLKRPRHEANTPKPRKKVFTTAPVFQMLESLHKSESESLPPTSEFSLQDISRLAELRNELGNKWKDISERMNKTPLDCYRMYLKHILKEDKSKWTKEEDEILKEAINRFGVKNWQEVANMIPGKSNTQCYHRWMKTIRPDIKKGHWDVEEDLRLCMAVKVHKPGNWVDVAKHVPNRTDIQCRERYCNILSPCIKVARWTHYEDTLIVLSVLVMGKRWSKIAKMISNRTDNQCWRRFKYLTRHSKLLFTLSVFKLRIPIEVSVSASVCNFLKSLNAMCGGSVSE